ncbi:MAG: S9 family peptidase [Candidatus Eremiobacteraeota bacterium]|nr:S9 family peptidase [Candidatus Eremiobacteraeota bacterium]MCW5866175.1 S9 family peptidase [Candidatus Eremiobacteraeota bacterium]
MKIASALLCIGLSALAWAQDGTVAPNENLVVEGVPPITRSLVEEIGLYTESRAAAFLSWHPTRREMLIQTRFADVAQVHSVAMPGGARKQLTFYPERVGYAHWRPGRGDGFMFSKDTGGNEFFQLYWKDAASGKVTLLTDGKSRNTGGVFARSGNKLAYESTKRTGQDTDIYWMNPGDPGSEKLLMQGQGGGWTVSDIAPDEKSVLLQNYLSANESQLWWLSTVTGEKKRLTNNTGKVAFSPAFYTPDGKSALYTSDEGDEFARLIQMDLSSGQSRVISPKYGWDVGGFTLSGDGKTLALVVNEAGAEKLHIFQFPSMKEIPVKARIPIGTIGGLTFHSNNRDLAFSLNSAQTSMDAYSVDVKTGVLTRWTESETGGLDASGFSTPEPVRWKSFDGKEIYGFLYKPPARFNGPRPVIINIHGGPESQFQPVFLGRNNYLLNELGVAIIFPNVRGSAGFGKSYLAADDWEKREDSVKDIGALLDWIGTQPGLDASRVMVTGGSYGGFMTLSSMTHYNDRLRGGLDVVGISNFVTFLEKTEGYRRDLRRVEYGDERDPKMRKYLEEISPTNNVGKITKPMFIVQGKNDPRVPLAEAEQMVAALRKKGGTCWYLMAKDEGHGFAKKKNADFQFYATVRFIQEVLLK